MTHSQATGDAELYQIRVRGVLDESWSEWFGGMSITLSRAGDGSRLTVLTGFIDQSALHGILAKIRNLNLKLVSVSRLQSGGITHQDHPPEPPP